MTVKELKEAIANLPDEGQVYIHRIEDVYFEQHGWSVKKMEGEMYHKYLQRNKDIDSGKYLDKDEYPNMRPEYLVKLTDEELDSMLEQYIDTFCCINYDDTNLYITSHY